MVECSLGITSQLISLDSEFLYKWERRDDDNLFTPRAAAVILLAKYQRSSLHQSPQHSLPKSAYARYRFKTLQSGSGARTGLKRLVDYPSDNSMYGRDNVSRVGRAMGGEYRCMKGWKLMS